MSGINAYLSKSKTPDVQTGVVSRCNSTAIRK